MNTIPTAALEIVDGQDLPESYRNVLKPDGIETDERGRRHRLPRYFLKIDSWQTARETQLAPSFGAYEFVNTDVREALVLRTFPRYVPLAVYHLAAHLAVLRNELNTYIHIAANGGYRSPSHGASSATSPHHWGTAVNIYRIGDDYLNSPGMLQHYADIVQRVLPGVWTRPYSVRVGGATDHLHIDLGRYCVTPRGTETGMNDAE